ncbi:hypothetical protein SELMODRAFT_72036, partial [Selaginella moellendorffii]
LIEMYGKFGDLANAQQVFDEINDPNLFSWTNLIVTYAHNGDCETSKGVFDRMPERDRSGDPNAVSFLGVLIANNHLGLFNEALRNLATMNRDHGVTPCVEHLCCISDLLGRSGLIESVEELIHGMPCLAENRVAWGSLFGACQI